ncbi:MAG TPA: long-chain fatty acid--CoA ligase [Saprospiraceae bacterium]|nr:long-chain fatty acid--CoA ligase [Saprospiraceae bacterium]HMQ81308.1 long-chain fatty acid--CoA ligase [Saprospiraceae bacterium]
MHAPFQPPATDWAAKWAIYQAQQIAFKEHESGRQLSYRSLNLLGNRLAVFLHQEKGLRKGDRVAVLAENCLEYLLLFVAAQKSGLILVPLNYRLAAPEIEYLLNNANVQLLLAEPQFLAKLESTSLYRKIPGLDWSSLQQLCTEEEAMESYDDFTPANIEEDDPIFLLYTSGTTGFPKASLYTHKMLFWNSINTAMSLVVNSESRTVNCMPPFHTGGWNVLTTPFLHHGGYTCLMKKFDASTVLRLLETEKTTIFMGVPTMLKMMAELPQFENSDLSSLYYIIVGGESMPIPLIEQWHAKGVPIRQGYGMTEVGPNLTSLHHRDAFAKMGSIGRPNFYVQIRIVDENGVSVPPGQSGELLLKGPMVSPGYWRNEEATAKALQDGWFLTGDRVRMDEDGYLFVIDRIKNMFISGGENVYPAEIERVLLEHDAVAEAAVFGVPDEKWGEVGKALIVLKKEKVCTDSELAQYCKEVLAKFKVPKYIQLVESLPKNDTGKIDRKAIKTLA